MEITTPRRRFLKVAGTGTALSLAGCNALQNQSDGDGGGGDGGGDGSPTVTLAVEPDREALQQRQQGIRDQLQSNEIGRREAQQQLQQAQTELLNNATDAFETRAEGESGITVDDSVTDVGVFLVSGDPAPLVGLLSAEEVAALLPESSFADAQAQASTPTEVQTDASG